VGVMLRRSTHQKRPILAPFGAFLLYYFGYNVGKKGNHTQ